MGFLERKNTMLGIVLASMILLLLTGWISSSLQGNMVHAQQQPIPQYHVSKSVGVKITSPIRGQQIPVGNNLNVSGMSKYNSTSNCQVFVILDGIKPYQKTIPAGLTGAGNNYSNWKYSLSPTYPASIKVGTNKITAKLLCQANPIDFTKFYSINVTGINQTIPKFVSTNNTSGAPSFLPITSNSSLANPTLDPTNNNTNPIATGSVHHTSSSNNDKTDESQHHTSTNSENGHHHIKNSSNDSSHHHKNKNNSGGGKNDLANKIIAHIKQRLGIG